MTEFLQKIILEVTIVFLPLGGNIPGIGECMQSGYMGGYQDQTKTVYVCRDVPFYTQFVENHELGHYFWNRYISEDERRRYENLYKSHLEKKNAFHRDYSKTNVGEDFADNFALIASNQRVRNFYQRMRVNLIKEFIQKYNSQK